MFFYVSDLLLICFSTFSLSLGGIQPRAPRWSGHLRSGVAEVRYRVGKGAFKAAKGTTSWKLSAKLKPGKNVIEIVTEDAAGNVSAPLLVKVKVKRKKK